MMFAYVCIREAGKARRRAVDRTVLSFGIVGTYVFFMKLIRTIKRRRQILSGPANLKFTGPHPSSIKNSHRKNDTHDLVQVLSHTVITVDSWVILLSFHLSRTETAIHQPAALMALHVFWAASGEVAAVVSAEELQGLEEEQQNTVQRLKVELMSRGLGSRFRMRLLKEEGEGMKDEDWLREDLKLVFVGFEPHDQEQLKAFLLFCEEGRLADVEECLQRPMDPSAADGNGWTGLHRAAQKGQAEVVHLLLEAGASAEVEMVDLYRRFGSTPLHLAAAKGHLHVVRLLLQAGIAPDQADQEGTSALEGAAAGGHLEVVRLLLDARASCNQADCISQTPLHCAAQYGHQDVVHLLLEAGATPDAERTDGSCFGSTPLHLAVQFGQVQVVRLLLDARAFCDPATAGVSPLHHAVDKGLVEVVRALLDARASPHRPRTDRVMRTPWQEACRRSHWDVMKLLEDAGATPEPFGL